MDNCDEYYSKIVYKKNAFCDLAVDLKVYYFQKRILFLTTKSVPVRFVTEVLNALSVAQCEFEQFVSKFNYDESELKQLSNKFIDKHFDLVVCLGSGKTTDVAKYYANIFNVPYICCPTAPTNISYFSAFCVNPHDVTRSFVAEEPERIYISEAIIKKSPKHLIRQGVLYVLSFYEYVLSVVIDNVLFDKNVDTTDIKKILSKCENNLDALLCGDDDEKLSLMDCLIDMGYYFRSIEFYNLSCFNMFLLLCKIAEKSEIKIGSGEALFVCSKLLIEAYIKLFSSKKIKRYDLPDFQKIAKKLQKYGIFIKKINNFCYFNRICNNFQLLERVNNLKEEFLFQCNKRKQEQKKSLNKISSYNKYNCNQKPNLEHYLSALEVLPFVGDNNIIVSLLGATGLMNSF